MALTKTVDGKPLAAGDFAYVGDAQDISTWHLPVDKDHIDSAVEMFGHEQHVPSSEKAKVARTIASKAKAAGIDTKDFESKYCGSADHADGNDGWIEIFRAGDYTKQGKTAISRSDLERVVRNYDPNFHEAPVCVGHPELDMPAYAWIDRVALDGDTLLAKEKQVDPAFAELRKNGRFKKRSASFYTDASGKVTGLRHVGWLGAQPPEVKGLKNLNFEDNGREFIELNFGEEESVLADDKSVKDQIKAFFAEMFGSQAQSQTFSEADVKRIATEAAAATATPLQTKITELETQLAAQKTEFAERETKIATSETKTKSIEAVNGLKSKGRWIPAFDKMGLPLVFDELAKVTTTIEFGEAGADGKKPQVAPLQMLVTFMEGLPKIVPDGRTFTGAKPGDRKTAVNFTEGRNVKADPNSIALTEQAHALAKEKNISFSEALDKVVAEHPELAVAGGSQAGAV